MPCRCTPEAIARYQGRISGPLLDRIDLVVDVPRPEIRIGPSDPHGGEPSRRVKERVRAAIRFAEGRGQARDATDIRLLSLDRFAVETLEQAARIQGLSLRAVHRTARVARTIADLAGSPEVSRSCVLEALVFRAGSALTSLKVA